MSYITELIETLKNVEISGKGISKALFYDNGVDALVERFVHVRDTGNAVFFIGNGGSAAIACHTTADYLKNGKMHTCSLYNSAVLTCLGNDYCYEEVFSKQLEMQMKENDILVAISSSGESLNIIRAIEVAEKIGGEIITFTGFGEDNAVRGRGGINVYVPCSKYGIVESIHNLILQQIVDMIVEKDNA